MLDKVKTWIEKYALIQEGEHVLAACSGGADSIALVHVLCRLQATYRFELSVAHVNHQLRGAESDKDAEFVEGFCRRLGLDCYQTQINVAAFQQEQGMSTEEAARVLRFEFLRGCAAKLGDAKIATGHHYEDQSETILMRLLRGTGSFGLKGMSPRENGIIRPLLAIRRSEVEVYCRENGLDWRTDSSNLTTDYLRNQIRLELLPYLEKHFNPSIKEALWRLSQIAADENEYIRSRAEEAQAISLQGDCTVLDREKIISAPPAIRRGILRLALEKCSGKLKGFSFEHVEMLINMAVSGRTGAIMPLPGGLTAKVAYRALVLGKPEAEPVTAIEPPGIELKVPGVTEVPALGIRVLAEISDNRLLAETRLQAVFDWAALTPPFFVRTRAAGDRFQPLGMTGTKKLKDFFIGEKVPHEKRDKTAIFSDLTGIIWIAGHRQSERGKICKHTNRFLRLSISMREDTHYD